MRVSVTSRTAVYGPVRTVVWEGWSREAPPYPDQWHLSDLVRGGRAVLLCPGRSDVDLFRDGESVVDLNPQIAHGALDLLVAQQKLDRPQIASATIYECRFG